MNKFDEIYTNPSNPGSFSGLSGFTRALKDKKIKATKSEIKKYLNSKEAYSLHKPKRLNYPRKKVVVSGINDTWQIDLVDVSALKSENDGNRFILTSIDVLSKNAQAGEMKNKEKVTSRDAFVKMIKKEKPKRVQCDKSSEFFNDVFKNIHRVYPHYSPNYPGLRYYSLNYPNFNYYSPNPNLNRGNSVNNS